MRVVLLVVLLVLIAVPAHASGPDSHDCAGCAGVDTGAEFGAHVAQHAQEGHLGPEMNPGHHHGFSSLR
ncbi:MAG TPA: hypothetical protein VNN19_11495 [bacterium]|nr:hypothetical protein [bacterium]